MDGNVSKSNSVVELAKLLGNVCNNIESGIDTVEKIFDSEPVNTVMDYVNTLDSVAEDTLKAYSAIKAVASIPTKLYLRKLDRYLRGLIDIPLEKRQKYIKMVSKERFNKESVYVLEVLNKIEELSKVDILLRLFELMMDEAISESEYRRMMVMTASTFYDDLIYMKQNITDSNLEIQCIETEGLLQAGWLVYAGMSWGTATTESTQLYIYTENAKRYCKVLWNITPKSENGEGPITVSLAQTTEEDIENLFVD